MKALSIRQPWAWLIVNGFKDIENRKWHTQFRGRIYVQSGKRMVLDDFPEQRQYFQSEGIVIPENLTLGAIIGELLRIVSSNLITHGFAVLTVSYSITHYPMKHQYPIEAS